MLCVYICGEIQIGTNFVWPAARFRLRWLNIYAYNVCPKKGDTQMVDQNHLSSKTTAVANNRDIGILEALIMFN